MNKTPPPPVNEVMAEDDWGSFGSKPNSRTFCIKRVKENKSTWQLGKDKKGDFPFTVPKFPDRLSVMSGNCLRGFQFVGISSRDIQEEEVCTAAGSMAIALM